MTAPSMAEVVLAHLADPDEASEHERDLADLIAQALADAGFGHVASVEADSLRVAALAHAIECYAGPDDDTLPVLRWWLTQLREAPDGEVTP